MKRSPLRRTASLSRRARLKPRRATPRRSSRVVDPQFLAVVRTLPCCAPWLPRCTSPAEAHHAGYRGIGQKSSDTEAIPLCRTHHSDWHDCRGVFAGWSKESRAEWAAAAIARTRAAVALMRSAQEPAIAF
jgi:hypothetical protein